MHLAEQFAVYGDVKDVREDPQIQGCWLLEYYDIRHAAAAYKAINRSSHTHASLPVVSESSASQGHSRGHGPQQPGALRNVQSSHVLNSMGGEFGGPSRGVEDTWQGSQSWDNKTGAAFQEQLASFMYSRQNGAQQRYMACACVFLYMTLLVLGVSYSPLPAQFYEDCRQGRQGWNSSSVINHHQLAHHSIARAPPGLIPLTGGSDRGLSSLCPHFVQPVCIAISTQRGFLSGQAWPLSLQSQSV